MKKKMGQTRDDIRDNIVKIVNENSHFIGTGFFIHKEYCVTCHHNIHVLDEIYVEREIYNDETGQTKRRFHADCVEGFSDMKKDVAFLKVQRADFKPLEYWKDTYGDIPVVVRGFRSEDLRSFHGGREVSGNITGSYEILHWDEEQMSVGGVKGKKKKWNMKPEVNVPVYAFNGDFSIGFSGAPVCYEKDWKVVGMFEAKDDKQGYLIPMKIVIQKFDLEVMGRKVSAPSPTLDAEKILDTGNDYLYRREYLKAIEQYDKILSDKNYPAALNNKGWALGKSGRYDEAIPYYDKAIAIDPTHTDALDNKGWALYHLGRYEEAIEQFDKTLEVDSKYADASNGKEWALRKLGKN